MQTLAEDKKADRLDELREIEKLYQSANREPNSPSADESLKALIAKYGKAKRTGGVWLYLGQIPEADKQESYLKQALRDHGDGGYGDGVQVGSYARFGLAQHQLSIGKKTEAEKLFVEIKTNRPGSVDHHGNRLVDSISK